MVGGGIEEPAERLGGGDEGHTGRLATPEDSAWKKDTKKT
jgi:hypothetical protein